MLVGAFEELGLEYTWPEGSYFVLLVSCGGLEWGGRADAVGMQDISRVRWPEDYPFPPTVEGRGRDFKYVSPSPSFILHSCSSSLVSSGRRGSSRTRLACRRSRSARYVHVACVGGGKLIRISTRIVVLLRGARWHRGELRAVRVLQGPRHAPRRGRAAAAPARVPRLRLPPASYRYRRRSSFFLVCSL